MSNDVVVYEGAPVAQEYKEVAAIPEKPKSVFVVRWNEHENDDGWINDREYRLSVFSSMEDAQKEVEDHFEIIGTNTLWGAGDFVYPSGPDNAYHVFEIFPPKGYPLYAFLEEYGSVGIPRYPVHNAWESIRKDVTMAMQNPDHKPTVVPFVGLEPKPITGEPTTMFFTPQSFSENREPLPALR
jgi:hypothetical protein